MAIPPVDYVGRTALLPVDLDDLAMSILVALMPPLDCQLVSDRCLHGSPSPAGTYPLRTGRSPAAAVRITRHSSLGSTGDRCLLVLCSSNFRSGRLADM